MGTIRNRQKCKVCGKFPIGGVRTKYGFFCNHGEAHEYTERMEKDIPKTNKIIVKGMIEITEMLSQCCKTEGNRKYAEQFKKRANTFRELQKVNE